jgi:hypothetical protein
MAALEKIIHAQHRGVACSKGQFAANMPRFTGWHQSPAAAWCLNSGDRESGQKRREP